MTGCVPKINPNEYTKIQAPKSKYLPNKSEINKKNRILVAKFKGKYRPLNDVATSTLRDLLVNYKAVKVINRAYKGIDNEIKLAEQARAYKTDVDQVDYVITGKIFAATTNNIFHRAVYWKDKKGRIHRSPPYWENVACIQGEMTIIKIPENKIITTKSLKKCAVKNTARRMYNLDSLLVYATQEAINDEKNYLYNLFAKKGYIFEIRRKDDELILHVTLGKNDGAKPGEKVYIYTIKEKKVPFSDEIKKDEVKIGEGTISNIVDSDDSWVVVDKKKEEIKIGDYVKPIHKTKWWQRVGRTFKDTINSVIIH
jgi:hypothetical protein